MSPHHIDKYYLIKILSQFSSFHSDYVYSSVSRFHFKSPFSFLCCFNILKNHYPFTYISSLKPFEEISENQS